MYFLVFEVKILKRKLYINTESRIMSFLFVVLITYATFGQTRGAATDILFRTQEDEYRVYSQEIFGSLLDMVSSPGCSTRWSSWLQFVAESWYSEDCWVFDLCAQYRANFMCGGRGSFQHLRRINLRGNGLSGSFPLSMIPDSVTNMNLERNQLESIGKWDDLRGKSLHFLDVTRNNALILNLDGLNGDQNHLPLKRLKVSKGQIKRVCAVMVEGC